MGVDRREESTRRRNERKGRGCRCSIGTFQGGRRLCLLVFFKYLPKGSLVLEDLLQELAVFAGLVLCVDGKACKALDKVAFNIL